MAPKSVKTSSSRTTDILLLETSADSQTPRNLDLTLILKGTPPGPGEYYFYAYFNRVTLIAGKWSHNDIFESEMMPVLNLDDPEVQEMIANTPLVLILRFAGGKGTKELDPLAHPDNRAGASVDLFPLILGEQKTMVTAPLVSVNTGERYADCSVIVRAVSEGTKDNNLVPLMLTMISVHCLPPAKDNTFYVSAIGLNELHEPKAINFNLSLSTENAEKIVFAAVSTAGYAANTAINVHSDDKFIPDDLKCHNKKTCRSFYWNAMKRVLVDPELLYERLSSPFMIEIAGVPRTGKIDIRGRYMGIVDARVLLEPGQMSVTVCSKLVLYNENNTLDNIGPLLDLPPTSAKSARDVDAKITDEFDHSTYAVIRFDLTESLVPKSKLEGLYYMMGFLPPGDANVLSNDTGSDSVQCDPVDAPTIRKEAGALAVHKELSGLACKGMIPMTQGIKRTAANRLLMRVRVMLKSFPPGECSYLDYQDTVTGQHASSRRAVTASFAPQPPPPRLPNKNAASRCRIAGDNRIADIHLETSLKVPNHPSVLISKILRCLEERDDAEAKIYLLEALKILTTNRYLLWIFGGIQFDQGPECSDRAGAALRIAVKGDYSDGTANAIGWAALHTFHHFHGNICAAHVAAKKMRKAFSLPVDWDLIINRWTETSGEEEVYWIPEVISSDNPLLIAAAFFLCLRCFRFSEKLLNCVEQECASYGVGTEYVKTKISPDVYYLRAASLILRRSYSSAMEKIQEAVDKFGPTPKISQMRVTCLACIRKWMWDEECSKALLEAENAGSVLCSSLLFSAALSELKTDPDTALQKAARAHKKNPSGHTSLLLGRIYAALGKQWFAERWLAVAVNTEPLLADGWAMLALLAMYDRNLNKARAMLRTARQAGPVSPDIEKELKRVMEKVGLDQLPDILVANLCLCDHID